MCLGALFTILPTFRESYPQAERGSDGGNSCSHSSSHHLSSCHPSQNIYRCFRISTQKLEIWKKIATSSYQDIPSIYQTWLSTLSILHHWSRHSAGRSPSAPESPDNVIRPFLAPGNGDPQKHGRGIYTQDLNSLPVVMHLMVNTLAMMDFFSSNEKYSFHFVSGSKMPQWETTCKKNCLSHLRKIAAGTSEDLLRNLCLCLESSPEELTGTQ